MIFVLYTAHWQSVHYGAPTSKHHRKIQKISNGHHFFSKIRHENDPQLYNFSVQSMVGRRGKFKVKKNYRKIEKKYENNFFILFLTLNFPRHPTIDCTKKLYS